MKNFRNKKWNEKLNPISQIDTHLAETPKKIQEHGFQSIPRNKYNIRINFTNNVHACKKK